MKDYIDLTQLPPAEINRMVEELNHNNVEGLRRFFERLGLLYGLPLDQVVNIFSDYLMFDKHKLWVAFDHFSHKHAVEMLSLMLETLSVETTPLSIVQELSLDVEHLESEISSIQSDVSSLYETVDNLSIEVSNRLDEQDNEISGIRELVQLSSLAGIRYNGSILSADENRIVDISDVENDLSSYFKGYVDGKIGNISIDKFIEMIRKQLKDNDLLSAIQFIPEDTSLTCVVKRQNKILKVLQGIANTDISIDDEDEEGTTFTATVLNDDGTISTVNIDGNDF